VHGLIPRHRRKAGSGPPATALIAWISADPHLRSAVARAGSHRRDIDLPPPAITRLARAAVAACFVLSCSAVLGSTAIMSDGLLSPLPSRGTESNVLGQSNADTREQGMPPAPAKTVDPHPASSAAPAAMAPAVAGAEQQQSAPLGTGRSDHPTVDHLGQPDGYVRSSLPAHPTTPRHSDKSGNSGKTMGPDKLGDSTMPADLVKPVDIDMSPEPDKPGKILLDATKRCRTGMLPSSSSSDPAGKLTGSRQPTEPGNSDIRGESQPTSRLK
jgi:hypothetical protein